MNPHFRSKINCIINEFDLPGYFILVGLMLMISMKGFGQSGCSNPATVTLSTTSGNTCNTTPVTVSGNTFGGRAKYVRITENGSGSVSPSYTSKSPFTFTYTPGKNDIGKTVVITVTTDNPSGPCLAVKTTYTLTVTANPTAPKVDVITQPTCLLPTGSVRLSGLPSSGSWTINPGAIQGTGTSTTVSGLTSGTYQFTVTNSTGCVSNASSNLVINAPPPNPVITITNPPAVCYTLKVDLTDPSVTAGSTPGLTYTYWTNLSATIAYNTPATADAGTYYIKGTTSSGCSAIKPVTVTVKALPSVNAGTGGSECSLNFTFNATAGAGSGIWSKVNGPGNAIFSPDANTANALVTVTAYGSYTFRWTIGYEGCSNSATVSVNFIQQPPANAGSGGYECDNDFIFNGSATSGTGTWTKISGPGNAVFTPDAHQPNAKVTVSQIGSYDFAWTEVNNSCTSTDIIRVIFRGPPSLDAGVDTAICRGANMQFNAQGTGFFAWQPAELVSNPNISNPVATATVTTTFTVTLTDQYGCRNSDDFIVEVKENPVADGGSDQVLRGQFNTNMTAELTNENETGNWSLISGTGEILDTSFSKTSVSGLSPGINKFTWRVSNGVCPPSFDTISIMVHDDYIIPTLITPNYDGKNDYFVIKGLDKMGQTELLVFNKSGIQVFKNPGYDNKWDGSDYNNKPLPDDTYFYILKPLNSKSFSGYIVIRR